MSETAPKPTIDDVQEWAIAAGYDLMKGPGPVEVKIATGYMRGYADAMAAMNRESFRELRESLTRLRLNLPPETTR